jgi:hypothetical protein
MGQEGATYMLWAAEVQTAKRDGTLYGSTMISMRLFGVDPLVKAGALTDPGQRRDL